MELILATADCRELKAIFDDIDIQIGEDENTFELTLDVSRWDNEIQFGRLLYVPDTEYGGIIKDIETSTSENKIYVRGYTWRGYLDHRIISPPSGYDYLTVSGELHTIMNSVLGGSLGTLFRVSGEDTGISITSYRFNRYVNYTAGISAMLKSKGYRLNIKYVQTDRSGYVELSAVPVSQYDDISKDYRLDFTTEDYGMGVNHLICLGQGELKDRTVIHLYADSQGNISRSKTISGINEIVEIYDNSSADNDQLLETGTERFKELLNYKDMRVFFAEAADELSIGDTITGTDYITGVSLTKPIARKIITRKDGIVSIEYKMEGEE